MAADPLIDHIERTFAEAYRKELDQEENVWRSLPFFAATLALEIAALAQMRDWLFGADSAISIAAGFLLAISGTATAAALSFLALSVWPADLRRPMRESAFLAYAHLVRLEMSLTMPEARPEVVAEIGLNMIKGLLAEQYALAVDHNRTVNQRRAKWRTRAGLATLISVFAVLVLVGLVVLQNLHVHG